jgi:hypothetical protein
MHKNEFGQAYCKDLLKSILNKFISYLSEFYTIYYEFFKLNKFLEIEIRKTDLEKIK